MNIEEFRNFCLSFPWVMEEFPFDNNPLVFKVMGRMFALCDVDEFENINLKCEPEKAIQLREEFPGVVIPDYHINKKLCPKGIPLGKYCNDGRPSSQECN